MTPASENTTIPPTLLRLPDLDPEASSMLHTVQPTAQEVPASKPEPELPSATKAMSTLGASTSSSVPIEAALHAADASRSAIPEPLARAHETKSRQTLRTSPETADTSVLEDESDSWLTTFASRKSLLVMLALIAALAIFFPRGDNATSEKGTPLLVDESSPEPTVVPFQLERYPGTKLAPPIASSPRPAVSPNRLSDPAKVIAPSTTSTVSAPLRQPAETPNEQNIAALAPPPSAMIPQPPKTPWDDQTQPESSVALFAPIDEAKPFAQNSQANQDRQSLASQSNSANQYPQTASPQSPQIKPGIADTLLNRGNSAQSMVNQSSPQQSGSNAEVPARLVNSRTPQGIYDWKKFLPPINSDSASANAPTSAVAQTPSQSPSATEIRTSRAPTAPNFEFALPGGSAPVASEAADSAAPVQTNRDGVPSFAPEARVAMPPQSSLR